jgi:hypothetical protein
VKRLVKFRYLTSRFKEAPRNSLRISNAAIAQFSISQTFHVWLPSQHGFAVQIRVVEFFSIKKGKAFQPCPFFFNYPNRFIRFL